MVRNGSYQLALDAILRLPPSSGPSSLRPLLSEWSATPQAYSALLKACTEGSLDLVRFFVSCCGVNPLEARDGVGRSALFSAIRGGSPSVASFLILECAADVDTPNAHLITPLMVAAIEGNIELASLLLRANANARALAKNGLSVLLLACQQGHAAVASLLISHGADVHGTTAEGFPALWVAARKGSRAIVQHLIAAGANVNAHAEPSTSTSTDSPGTAVSSALWIACSGGHEDVAVLLLDEGADLEARGPDGCTPLLVACREGHFELVEKLIGRGANVNATASDGSNALWVACEKGHYDVVETLLEATARSDTGRGAMALVNGGGGGNGIPPLVICAERGFSELAALLLEHDATVDAADAFGASALWVACQQGYSEMVELLVSRGGANVNVVDADGISPLSVASECGHSAIVAYLLDHGADVEAVDRAGATALLVAAKEGKKEVVELLVARGANVGKADEQGVRPSMAALRGGHREVAAVLQAKEGSLSLGLAISS